MKHVFTWRAVGITAILWLVAAAFALINGNDDLGVALVVVAVAEAVFVAAMAAFAQRKTRSG
jgi:hypothetical protein